MYRRCLTVSYIFTKYYVTSLLSYGQTDKVITVNVFIFAGGKFCENVGETFHVGVIFTILLIFP